MFILFSARCFALPQLSYWVKIIVFGYIALCRLAEVGRRFRGVYCLHYQGDCLDGGSKLLRNVG
jgi:hypothetical protein